MYAKALASTPTLQKEGGYIKVAESDEFAARDMQNVTEIDGGIVDYVRQRMGFKRVTREVVRQAIAFENEMSRMQGW